MKKLHLNDLISSVPINFKGDVRKVLVSGITQDSRDVKPGYLFVAVQGSHTDGHLYIHEALREGAAAVIGTRFMESFPVPYLQVEDARLAFAYLSAAFYGFPARKLLMIGVTGTDGKTTTANLIFNILKSSGHKTGLISTVNAVIDEKQLDTGFHVTTPEAVVIQHYLFNMVNSGLTHVVLEVTSHGLEQHRVTACDFDIGVVTNIAHEHLDYHGTYKAYQSAKGMLFSGLESSHPKEFNPPRAAVLNKDDDSYSYLSGLSKVQQISYGLETKADLVAVNINESSIGIKFEAQGCDKNGDFVSLPVFTHFQGIYNVSNCLAAIATTKSILGLDAAHIQQGIESLNYIPGRMEKIDLGQDFLTIVDFAHTPNALRNVLETARRLTDGRIIAIFGSAGLRDKAKRRMMAEISADLADLTVLTAEDPRTESLDGILDEMAQGLRSKNAVEGKTFWRIPDRREAIRFGLSLARYGDVVISCGKGHEQSMCFGDVEYPWDDRVAVRAALAEQLSVEGPDMPFLPGIY